MKNPCPVQARIEGSLLPSGTLCKCASTSYTAGAAQTQPSGGGCTVGILVSADTASVGVHTQRPCCWKPTSRSPNSIIQFDHARQVLVTIASLLWGFRLTGCAPLPPRPPLLPCTPPYPHPLHPQGIADGNSQWPCCFHVPNSLDISSCRHSAICSSYTGLAFDP